MVWTLCRTRLSKSTSQDLLSSSCAVAEGSATPKELDEVMTKQDQGLQQTWILWTNWRRACRRCSFFLTASGWREAEGVGEVHDGRTLSFNLDSSVGYGAIASSRRALPAWPHRPCYIHTFLPIQSGTTRGRANIPRKALLASQSVSSKPNHLITLAPLFPALILIASHGTFLGCVLMNHGSLSNFFTTMLSALWWRALRKVTACNVLVF